MQIAIAFASLVVTTTVFTIIFARMAYVTGFTKGIHAANGERLKQEVTAALNGKLPISMDAYEFQCNVTWTGGRRFAGTLAGFVHLVHKLAGEAGEFNEHWGKAIRDDDITFDAFNKGRVELTPERRTLLIKELGDVLWYVAIIARELNSSLLEVAITNMRKLADRAKRGVIRGDGDAR